MITLPSSPSCRLQRWVLQAVTVSTLTTAGVLLGVVPSLQPVSFNLSFDAAAYAQSVSAEEVQNYARSVLAIEPIRMSAYNKIKQITGSDEVPPVACHRPSSLSNLPENIRDIAIDYCNQAIAIVESNDLTITRFNQITIAHQSDAALSNRIQQVINRIQQGG